MKKTVLFLIMTVLLLLPTGSQAQSGGDYDLAWDTVDGGGYAWSASGTLKLGGTIGQPDVGSSSLMGGNYTIQGGFWHSPCKPQVVLTTITCNGDHVTLNWTANTADKAYAIYRSSLPYQLPLSDDPLATVLTPPWNDSTNTCGDININYYYVVRAVCVGAHADDAEHAEFDFNLTPGN